MTLGAGNPVSTAPLWRGASYQRLRGVRDGGMARPRMALWLGPDHLLVVEGSYIERYRRIRFEDVQAISHAETASSRHVSLVLVAFAALLSAALFTPLLYGGRFSEIIGLQLLTVPILGGALVNHLLGPSCRFVLQTAVQTLAFARCRLRRAEEAHQLLVARIEAIQGSVPSDEASRRLGDYLDAHPDLLREPSRRVSWGLLHLIAFASVLASAALATVNALSYTPAVDFAHSSAALVGSALLIAAVADQTRSTVPPSLRVLTWWALGAQLLMLVILGGVGVVVVLQSVEPGEAMDPFLFMNVPNPYRAPMLLLSLLFGLPFALPGLFMTLAYRRKLRSPVPEAEP